MHRTRPILSLPLASLLLLYACGGSKVPHLDSPGTTIVCFGDSITYGIGAQEAESYPQRLAERLGVNLVNLGVPGDTTADGLARLDEVLAADPWLVIVEFGGNDILGRRPLAETEASLRGILDGLLAARIVPVVIEIRNPLDGDPMRELFARLKAEYGVPMVEDTLPRILLRPGLKADPIHPNAKGYDKLAEAVAREIKPLLKARGVR
jgi:lysophospholipase L1-like esterase